MSAAKALTAVQQYIATFDDGDETAMSSLFAPDGVIVDGMAPHVASEYAVTLDDPLHYNVTGARFTVAVRRLSAVRRIAAWA
ncbi:hypothetical protein EV589_4394 [Mycobacterium sp. BK558]|nr:hypothetical protein EV589_4394 [Mycobacterium sp. BK558]